LYTLYLIACTLTLHQSQPHPYSYPVMREERGGPQEAAGEFAESLAALPAGALARVGADAAGSRALEALFAGAAAPAKARRRALRRLAGRLGALAAEPGGSHVVQAAYAAAVRARAAPARLASPHRCSPRPGPAVARVCRGACQSLGV